MSNSTSHLRKRLAETQTSSLLVRARALAAGFTTGAHRADRKGSGVEFAGHRSYSPGDDLRHLDRHALLRHNQLLIREFLTDTERSVHLVVDASPSMSYRGSSEKNETTPSKLQTALLLAAALAFVAKSSGDRIGLTLITEKSVSTVKPRAGRDAFEHILYEFETLDLAETRVSPTWDEAAAPVSVDWTAIFGSLGVLVPRGSIFFVFSDFLDLKVPERRALATLSTEGRTVRAAQILTTEEVLFPFVGSLRLQDIERHHEVETDAAAVRSDYLKALRELTLSLTQDVEGQGGFVRRVLTSAPADRELRALALGTQSFETEERS